MVEHWLSICLVLMIVVASGTVLAVALLKASWARREREMLTSMDLAALEESAVILVEQIRAEADRATAQIDQRSAELRKLLDEAGRKLELLSSADTSLDVIVSGDSFSDISLSLVDEYRGKDSSEQQQSPCGPTPSGQRERVLELAAKGMTPADIARTTGLDCAEVNLMLSLGGMSRS